MCGLEDITDTMSITEARAKLSHMPDLTRDKRIIYVTRRDKLQFAIVGLDTMAALENVAKLMAIRAGNFT
jgi:hypothetical protein